MTTILSVFGQTDLNIRKELPNGKKERAVTWGLIILSTYKKPDGPHNGEA